MAAQAALNRAAGPGGRRTARRAWFTCLVLPVLLGAAGPAGPASARWDRFTAILWQDDLPPAALRALPGIGITGARVFGQRTRQVDAAALSAGLDRVRRAGLDPMVENIATDYYAAYHRWQPDRAVNAAFQGLVAHARQQRDPSLWLRHPSLGDAAVLGTIERRLSVHAEATLQRPALYLSLGDETGIADLSAAWDFDETGSVVQAWRRSLRARYGSVSRLDRAWHSRFRRWSDVRPTRTDQALDGTGPLAAWLEYKDWMDARFAAALRRGTAAIHRADPEARAAIEGVQLPGWGGYDYPRLAPAVDVIEDGSVGYGFSVLRAFHPGLVLLTTVQGDGPEDAHRLWRALLLGGRGAVIWDPDGRVMRPDGVAGPRGVSLAPVLAALRGPLGTRLLQAEPQRDTVGVLYSQNSFRMRWLLDRRADRARGLDWTQRSNDQDLADSPWRAALEDAGTALAHLGHTAQWLDADALTQSRLAGLHAILLPQDIVLSDRAVVLLRDFAAKGGMLVADGEPGIFDAAGRVRTRSPLDRVIRRVPALDAGSLRPLLPESVAVLAATNGRLRSDVSVFRYRRGMVAIQADHTGPPDEAVLDLPTLCLRVRLDAVVPTVLTLPGAVGDKR